MPRKLSDLDREEIVSLYRTTEETTSTLANRYGVNSSTVSRFLKSQLSDSEYESLIQQKRLGRTPGERSKGDTLLAQQLENIAKSRLPSEKKSVRDYESQNYLKRDTQQNLKVAHSSDSENYLVLHGDPNLPSSKRFKLPHTTFIPRENLQHHMVLPLNVEKHFQRIEREYAARGRLASYGLPYRKKILLYGPPGCGKTLGASRLAWNTGLPLLKVRFDTMVSSFLGETASNLRLVFDEARSNPCLLFLDECDSIASSRQNYQEVGEIKRVVNIFLQILDEYDPNSGFLVAATNLTKQSDSALWRRFDDLIEIPLPGEKELEIILKQTLSAISVGSIDWRAIINQMKNFSYSQAVRVAQDAAKRAIMDRVGLVIQEHLEEAIQEIKISTTNR